MKANGLLTQSNLKETYGFTDTATVKLDFDNTKFKTVKYWSNRANKHFELEGYIILKSSGGNYHVIFNRPVSWSENMRIVAWVTLLFYGKKLEAYPLVRWFLMQCIKEGSTLRVSPKKTSVEVKPSPRVVYHYGSQKEQIKGFLSSRRLIKNMIRQLLC